MRRIHYSGKYPKHFQEKYKELQPDKYGAMAEHVTRKGNTPAGTHLPIMVREILEQLRIRPGDKGFDATLGYGGHTRAMLDALEGRGHLCATDVDPIEIVKTEQRLRDAGYGEDILTIRHQNFAGIRRLAAEFGPFDFILADLGISSMQLDNPARGFTYKADGPLDLRMNPEKGESAAQLLRKLAQDPADLASLFVENSDEPYAEAIARTISGDLRRGVRSKRRAPCATKSPAPCPSCPGRNKRTPSRKAVPVCSRPCASTSTANWKPCTRFWTPCPTCSPPAAA